MLRDVRIGFRYLLSRKTTTLAIIAVLAVGIGANTSVFSAFEAWVLRPLDFREPERLVLLQEAQPKVGRDRISLSAKNYRDWTEQQTSFDAAGVFHRHRYNLADAGEPIRIDGSRISASLFPLLGKAPILGRGFDAGDDRPGAPAAVVLVSEQIWRERFDSDPGVVGRTLRLDGRVHTIVGVMIYGVLATLIAAIGLYGITVDAVVSRTKELAIRTALGADRPALVSLVMREALYLGGAGIASGLVLTYGLARAASSMLVSVSTRDPVPFVAVGSVLFVVLVGAALHPARRASRLNPISALRAE